MSFMNMGGAYETKIVEQRSCSLLSCCFMCVTMYK